MHKKCSFCDALFRPTLLDDQTPFSHPTDYCSKTCYETWKQESLRLMACRKKHDCELYLIPHANLHSARAWCPVCKHVVHMKFVGARRALDMLAANAEANAARDLLSCSVEH